MAYIYQTLSYNSGFNNIKNLPPSHPEGGYNRNEPPLGGSFLLCLVNATLLFSV